VGSPRKKTRSRGLSDMRIGVDHWCRRRLRRLPTCCPSLAAEGPTRLAGRIRALGSRPAAWLTNPPQPSRRSRWSAAFGEWKPRAGESRWICRSASAWLRDLAGPGHAPPGDFESRSVFQPPKATIGPRSDALEVVLVGPWASGPTSWMNDGSSFILRLCGRASGRDAGDLIERA